MEEINRLKKQGYHYIELPYKRFNTVIAYEDGISPSVKNIINTVEECKIENGNLISKFTHTAIELGKLSEGCKTVIYIYFRARLVPNQKEIIDITLCGPNAIEYILNQYNDAELTLYLGHWELPKNIKTEFKMNTEIIKNSSDIFI